MTKPELVFVTKANEGEVMASLPVQPVAQEFSVMTDENGELDMSTVKEIPPDTRTASMSQIINAPGTPILKVVE